MQLLVLTGRYLRIVTTTDNLYCTLLTLLVGALRSGMPNFLRYYQLLGIKKLSVTLAEWRGNTKEERRRGPAGTCGSVRAVRESLACVSDCLNTCFGR